MEKINLYIDFDGVILDTLTVPYQRIQEKNIASDSESVRKFFEKFDFSTVVKDENIINDSINCVDKIIKSQRFNVAILTHVNSLQEAVVKIKYIRRYFKDITIIPCPKEIEKTKMIETKNSILIDDYAGNLRQWQKEGGIGIRFSLKRNPKGFLVINKLDQILDFKYDFQITVTDNDMIVNKI